MMVYRPQKKIHIRCWLVTLLFVGIPLAICICTSYISLRLLQVVSIESIKGQDNDMKSGILNYWKWIYRTELVEESKTIDKNGINHLSESHASQLPNHVIVCYYTTSNALRPQWGLNPSYIDPHVCTHIIVGFARVVNCTLSLGEATWIYEEIVQLKYYEPNLKVMVSAGGMNEQEYGFPEMVKNHVNRKKFIRSVLKITKALKLDGLDLDWEFPAWLNNNKHQKVNFVQLIQELRKEFDHSGQELILSVAVAASQAIIDQSYDIPDIAPYVNFVNLMAYDYHFYQWYFPVTDLNSPLYARSTETGYLSNLNVNFSAHYWVAKGMPQEKLVVGIPTYGHSYHLTNPVNHNLHAPASGVGNLGVDGFVQYSTVCQFLQQGAYRVFEIESRVPYAYKDLEWISYDDIDSVYYKTQWILSNNFKGAMIFSLNVDDWNGTCVENETFPLTRLVWNILRNYRRNV